MHALDRRVQTGPEERVHHHARARELPAQRIELARRLDRRHGALPLPEHLGGVTPDVVGATDQPDLGAEPRAAQVAPHDDTVPAVVALAAADDDRAAGPRPCGAEHARRSLAGALHQYRPRGPVLDRPAVERAHLRRADDDHAGTAVIAATISRTAAAIPTS